MTAINENEMYGMYEIDIDADIPEMLAKKIDKAYNRKGKKGSCSICGDDWFKKDMITVNGKDICPICAAVHEIEV